MRRNSLASLLSFHSTVRTQVQRNRTGRLSQRVQHSETWHSLTLKQPECQLNNRRRTTPTWERGCALSSPYAPTAAPRNRPRRPMHVHGDQRSSEKQRVDRLMHAIGPKPRMLMPEECVCRNCSDVMCLCRSTNGMQIHASCQRPDQCPWVNNSTPPS